MAVGSIVRRPIIANDLMVGPGLAQNGPDAIGVILSPSPSTSLRIDSAEAKNLKGLLAKTKDGVGDSHLRP